MRAAIVGLLIGVVAARAVAVESVVRAGYEHDLDHGYDLRIAVPGGTQRERRHWSEDPRFVGDLLLRGRWLVGGLGLTYESATDHGLDVTRTDTAIVARAEFGLGRRIGDWFRVDLLPFAGYGGAGWKSSFPGGATDRDRAPCIQWGGHGDVAFVVPHLLEIGMGGGWMRQETHFIELAAGPTRLREDGAFWRAFMAFVF